MCKTLVLSLMLAFLAGSVAFFKPSTATPLHVEDFGIFPTDNADDVNFLRFNCLTHVITIDKPNGTTNEPSAPNYSIFKIPLNVTLITHNTSRWSGVRIWSMQFIGCSQWDHISANTNLLPSYILNVDPYYNQVLGSTSLCKIYTNGSSFQITFNCTLVQCTRNGTNSFPQPGSGIHYNVDIIYWFAFLMVDYVDSSGTSMGWDGTYPNRMSECPVFQMNTTFSYASPPTNNNTTPDKPSGYTMTEMIIVGGIAAGVAGIVVGVSAAAIAKKRRGP